MLCQFLRISIILLSELHARHSSRWPNHWDRWNVVRSKEKDPRERKPAISQLIFGIKLSFPLFKDVGLYYRKAKRIVLYHIPDRKEVLLIPLILANEWGKNNYIR